MDGHGRRAPRTEEVAGSPTGTRRALLEQAGRLGLAGSLLGGLEALAVAPARAAATRRSRLPDIQFDLDDFIGPARTIDGVVVVRFPPVYTSHTTLALTRRPTRADQKHLTESLDVIERALPFSPRGVFMIIGYGIPYFTRLPGEGRRGRRPRRRRRPSAHARVDAYGYQARPRAVNARTGARTSG